MSFLFPQKLSQLNCIFNCAQHDNWHSNETGSPNQQHPPNNPQSWGTALQRSTKIATALKSRKKIFTLLLYFTVLIIMVHLHVQSCTSTLLYSVHHSSLTFSPSLVCTFGVTSVLQHLYLVWSYEQKVKHWEFGLLSATSRPVCGE